MENQIFSQLAEYGLAGVVIFGLGSALVVLWRDMKEINRQHNERMSEMGKRMDEKDERYRLERVQSQEVVRIALERNTNAVDRLCTLIDMSQKR